MSLENKTAGFIHIGKTGGSSLTSVLRNGCHSFVPKPCSVIPNETIVSELVTDYYHVPDVDKIPTSKHDIYIISVRDPLERLVSGFCYTHPKNRKARGARGRGVRLRQNLKDYACFPTLEHFAQAVGKDIGNCTEHARAAVDGNEPTMVHFGGNYQKMAAPIHSQALVYVIRNEHLWQDWYSVNKMLDPTRGVHSVQTHVRDAQKVPQPMTRDLSDEGRAFLCGAIEKEYGVFFRLLGRAVNLDETDIQEARDKALQNCPNLKLFDETQ